MSDDLDLHYKTVTKAITDGRVVFFLGAGANLCGRPQDENWQRGQHNYLPSGIELAEYLADEFSYPPSKELVDCPALQKKVEVLIKSKDLARVSQFVDVMNGDGPLYDKLHDIFNHDYPPTDVHKFLAKLPAALREKGCDFCHQLIVTTNYDDVLERAFYDENESFDLVYYEAKGQQRGKFIHRKYVMSSKDKPVWPLHDVEAYLIEKPKEYFELALDQRTVILKIHGTVNRPTVNFDQDSYVVTEDHFIDYLTHTEINDLLPKTLAVKLYRSHFLFLGYALRDWNLRVILYRLWQQRELSFKSWAIQLEPDAIDQEFWKRYDVEFKNIRLENYIATLNTRI